MRACVRACVCVCDRIQSGEIKCIYEESQVGLSSNGQRDDKNKKILT